MEEHIAFPSGSETLSGILHLPMSTARPEFGFVFVHSGSRGRRGNAFQYTLYARHLCDLGYPCFRFDPTGVGDSTGTIDTVKVHDFYGSIQTGRFVQDTVDAVKVFRRRVDPRRLILFGICGGAITSLLAAPTIRGIDGLVLLSIPVFIDSSLQNRTARVPKVFARQYLIMNYARKLTSLKAWTRLLGGKSEVRTIVGYLKASLLGTDQRTDHASKEESESGVIFNHEFLECFDAMIKRRAKVIFLFGDDDTFRWEFEREFHRKYWSLNPNYARQSQIHYLSGCNHMFSLREWQYQALDHVSSWMETF